MDMKSLTVKLQLGDCKVIYTDVMNGTKRFI